MAGPNLFEREPHAEAEELLPWYANGQLDDADRSRVEKHLSSCASCRQQLALERQLIDEFQAMSPEIESGWARLRERVQAPIAKRQRRAGRLAEFWALITRPAVAGLAAAQLAFVIASGAVLLSLSRPAYHTLGSAPVPVSANIIVMFRADATIEDVRGTLKSAGASIVDGPTTADAYLLHVAPQQRQRALAKLQSDDNIQMAQPIDGAAS
ncbi:anti-sigma factor family protein [Sphingomonas sp.]|uniref:anti-sigma factor family protein n=1 Tax=Sphingomonas sp. TaxID=28214 RepID=UPI0038A5D23C